MLIWPAKDPDEVLDYSWSPALDEGDTIATFTAELVEGDVTIDSSSETDTTGTVWISGGTEASQLRLVAVTAAGRTFEETVALPIRDSGSDFASSFVAVFPAFSAVAQEAIDYWHARALRSIDDSFADDQAHAVMLFTAHSLVMRGLGTGVDAQRASQFAGATRIKSGSLELSWSENAKSTGSIYGDELLGLFKAYWGGPFVASTGSVDGYVASGGY